MKKNLPKTISISNEVIDKIYTMRGAKIMLDDDLAAMYGVETKQLKRQVKRNLHRFPEDFMFELTLDERVNLRSQIGTSRWGGTRYAPYAFTEQGVAMLSSILNSKRAVAINIQIMRVFVNIRTMAFQHKDIIRKLDNLERKVSDHDNDIREVFLNLKELLQPAVINKKPIGFLIPNSKEGITSRQKTKSKKK